MMVYHQTADEIREGCEKLKRKFRRDGPSLAGILRLQDAFLVLGAEFRAKKAKKIQ